MKNSNKTQSAINALRAKVANLKAETHTFNQAAKALSGLDNKCAEEREALGIKSFSVKEIRSVWSGALRVDNGEGGTCLALYLDEQVTTKIDEDGKEKDKNLYERKEGKKSVSFKTLKRRTLQVPDAWTPDLIIEGLAQSKELEAAVTEAEAQNLHVANVLRKEVYIKVTKKDAATGATNISYEVVEVSAKKD